MENVGKPAIVIDHGADTCKAGFTDDDKPSVICSSRVMYCQQQYQQQQQRQQQQQQPEMEVLVGHKVPPNDYTIESHPLDNGIVEDWDAMEHLWKHIFDQLEANPSEHHVLLTEKTIRIPKANREKMVELMFEKFDVGGLHAAKQAQLVMYGCSRLTGACVDLGHRSSFVVPVYEGYWLPSEVTPFDVTGSDLTDYMNVLIGEQQQGYYSSNKNNDKRNNKQHIEEHIRSIKEKFGVVANYDYEGDLKQSQTDFDYDRSHYLPNGEVITINSERLKCTEALFKPSLIGRPSSDSLPEAIRRCIGKCDLDIRQGLYMNIVLSGRTRLLPGLQERLDFEVQGISPIGYRHRIVQMPEEDYLSFKGGCVFANDHLNHASHGRGWIDRSEYEEHGPYIVHRKCY